MLTDEEARTLKAEMGSIGKAWEKVIVGSDGWQAVIADLERRTVDVYRALARSCPVAGEVNFYFHSAKLHERRAEEFEDDARGAAGEAPTQEQIA